MTWITVAVIGGSALVGAGASIYAGNQANRATTGAANQADATTRYMFDLTRSDLAPYRNIGNAALGDLAYLYGWQDPNAPPAGGSYQPVPGMNTASVGTGGGGLPSALNPLNALPGGSLSPLGVFGHKDPLSKLIGGLFGGGGPSWIYRQNDQGMIEFNGKNSGKDQLGGYINPSTGEVWLSHDPYNQKAQIEKYLRTGQGTLPKNASRFGQAVDAMRQAGWNYTAPAQTQGTAQRVGYSDTPIPSGPIKPGGSSTGSVFGSLANAGYFPNASAQAAAGQTTGQPSNMDRFFASPDYEFRLDQANKSLLNTYAARGGVLSGPGLNAALERSGQLASGEFNNYRNSLLAAAGLGQVSTGQQVAANQNTAANLSNIYTNAGAQRASTYGNMAAGVNSAIQGSLGNYMLLRYLNA